jgi:serine/threonine protein kinase
MADLQHPNIVKFMGFCRVPPCIMTEVCSKGNLSEILAKKLDQNLPFPWKERLQVVREY